MINFYLFFLGLVVGNSLYSLKDYSVYKTFYSKLKFFRFSKISNLWVANDNTNEECVVIDKWNYKVRPGYYLYFDIWILVDFHKLYWHYKTRKQLKKMGVI
jgi:hypothetical protein